MRKIGSTIKKTSCFKGESPTSPLLTRVFWLVDFTTKYFTQGRKVRPKSTEGPTVGKNTPPGKKP